jgi:formylglycine-generating enzyme required for sulfatase activity
MPSFRYFSPYDCPGYRLPTEAEWEYAARAGTTAARYGELDNVAWYDGNSRGYTHEVGGLAPNDWGLYDILGNVMEWCYDWDDSYEEGPVTDPYVPDDEHYARTRRGGYYNFDANSIRAASRNAGIPDEQERYDGFRPVRTLGL